MDTVKRTMLSLKFEHTEPALSDHRHPVASAVRLMEPASAIHLELIHEMSNKSSFHKVAVFLSTETETNAFSDGEDRRFQQSTGINRRTESWVCVLRQEMMPFYLCFFGFQKPKICGIFTKFCYFFINMVSL